MTVRGLGLMSAHLKLQGLEFCLILRLVYFIAQALASTCALSSIYSLPCNNFVEKVIPQVKSLGLFVTAFKDLYVSQKGISQCEKSF
jgi:hypothetical protein